MSTTGEPLPKTPGAQPPRRGLKRIFRSADEPLGPNYRKLWIASTISNLGDGVRLTALPLMAATITRDPASIAAIDLASTLPWFLFALFSGALGAAFGGFVASVFGLHAPFYVGAAVLGLMAVTALPLVNNKTIAAARAAAEDR